MPLDRMLGIPHSAAPDDESFTLDWQSVCGISRSRGAEGLLTRSGMPEVFARYMLDCASTIDRNIILEVMRSTFISYGAPDIAFASRLYEALRRNGVRTFLFGRDAMPGARLHHVMRDAIRAHDRVVLICSRASLTRSGVLYEIEETLAREAREGGVTCLIPVTIDDFVFEWQPERIGLAEEIRGRVIADFRGAEDDAVFQDALVKLIRALAFD